MRKVYQRNVGGMWFPPSVIRAENNNSTDYQFIGPTGVTCNISKREAEKIIKDFSMKEKEEV